MSTSFKQKSVLLVTSQIMQRSGLRKSLTDFGIDNRLIEIAADYDQARDRLTKGAVGMLITDSDIGNNKKGMDLLELYMKNNPVSKERIFMIMVSESSPFVLADFSLKGGDVILSKPFTNEAFISTVTKAVAAKEKMPPDECTAMDIQDALNEGDLERAVSLQKNFKNGSAIHALYCQARIHEVQQELALAFEAYVRAVKIKPDFKSLVNIVKIGIILQKHFGMVEYVELWLKNFPLHHDSIQDIARIIIANKRFDILDLLFDLFAKNKINDNFAKVPLAAGFVMASSYHLELGQPDKVKQYALRAVEYSCKKMPVIYKALEILVRTGIADEAEKIYLKLSFPTVSPEDKVIDLKMKDIIYPKAQVLADCNKLLGAKMVDEEVYRITISCLRAMGKDPGEVITQAKKAFPKVSFE